MLIWVIDEEWAEYKIEEKEIKEVFPDCEIRYSSYDFHKDLDDFGYKADGILVQIYAYMTKEVIDKLQNCKVMAVYGGGYDRVDVEAATKKGIRVTNVQKYCAEDVSDYVIAAIFHVNKNIAYYNSIVRENAKNGIWDVTKTMDLEHRLNKSTLLILGVGDIGNVVARKAKALGMNVIGYDEYKTEEELSKFGVKKVSWDEGLKNADFISVNLKGVDANADKLRYEDFKKMKNNAYIINTARGKIINEPDLVRAVDEKLIRGAILDVIKNEPPEKDEKILNQEGIIVTPHMSYLSKETLVDLQYKTAINLLSVLQGKEPQNPVN